MPAQSNETDTSLADRLVGPFSPTLTRTDPGRRLRCFALLVRTVCSEQPGHDALEVKGDLTWRSRPLVRPISFAAALRAFEHTPRWAVGHEILTALPIAVYTTRAPALHPALQDLAERLIYDLCAAAEAYDTPTLYYPGVDPPAIEPVPDEHVVAVIAGMQRELNHERRASGMYGKLLPPAPLAELPWAVQRALVERRRLRFQEYGITPHVWRGGRWSLFSVPCDPDWLPTPWSE